VKKWIFAYIDTEGRTIEMHKIRRVAIADAQKYALPILVAGFKKRRKLRSTAEESLRSPEKVARDRVDSSKPHICTI
jgi:hypothetical protein